MCVSENNLSICVVTQLAKNDSTDEHLCCTVFSASYLIVFIQIHFVDLFQEIHKTAKSKFCLDNNKYFKHLSKSFVNKASESLDINVYVGVLI